MKEVKYLLFPIAFAVIIFFFGTSLAKLILIAEPVMGNAEPTSLQATPCVKILKKYGENENKGPACTEYLFCFYFELSDSTKVAIGPGYFHRYAIGDCYP